MKRAQWPNMQWKFPLAMWPIAASSLYVCPFSTFTLLLACWYFSVSNAKDFPSCSNSSLIAGALKRAQWPNMQWKFPLAMWPIVNWQRMEIYRASQIGQQFLQQDCPWPIKNCLVKKQSLWQKIGWFQGRSFYLWNVKVGMFHIRDFNFIAIIYFREHEVI